MEIMKYDEFKKNIFKKETFEQYVISPYSGEPNSIYNRVLVLSDKVETPTYLTFRNRKDALILPFTKDIKELLKNHFNEIQKFTGVQATFFTLMDIEREKNLMTV